MGLTVHFEVLNQLGTPLMYSATLANRPAAGIAGRIFFRTDSPFGIYRDTGTAWDLIAQSGGGTITGSGAATQIAFWNSASALSGSNNLWYDSTNSYLGINTNAPGNPLDVHGSISSVAALNQTTATNNTLLSLLNSGTPLWRIGNFYTAGANDFGIFDVVNSTQQLTIVKSTGQTFVGAKTTASGRLVVNSATADAHLQVVGANSPSIRIDNAGSGGTQRFVFGLATATNNFIQGSAAGEFCISTQSAGNMLFGMWQTVNASEVMRITTSNNLLIGSSVDGGQRLQITGSARATRYFLDGMTAGNGALYWTSDRVTLANYNVGGTLSFEVNGGVSALTISSTNAAAFVGSLSSSSLDVTGNARFRSASNWMQFETNVLTSQNSDGAHIRSVISTDANPTYSYVGDTDTGMFNPSANVLGFSTGGVERARLTSSGNLLLGTTTDNGEKIQIFGSGSFNNGSNSTNGIKVVSAISSSLFTGGIEFLRTTVLAGSKIEPIRDASIGGVGLKFLTTINNAAEGSGTYNTALTIESTGVSTFSSSVNIGNSVAVSVAAPSTHKISILVGGVQYYLLASNI